MTSHHAGEPDPTGPGPAELLDDAQTAVAELLTTIANLAPLINALTDSRQRGLGFLTYEGKQIQDEMIRKDRTDLAERQRAARAIGLLPKDGFITGRGETRAAGNIVAISVEAQLHAGLHHQARRLTAAIARTGVCSLTKVPENATTTQLVAALRALVWQTTTTDPLDEMGRDLEALIEDALRLIDGNDRTVLGANCPHCDRRTLVVYFADDLIRCDRDPKTGRYEPCTCPESICECKSRPQAFRHEWHRAKKPNWHDLDIRINHTRATDASTAEDADRKAAR